MTYPLGPPDDALAPSARLGLRLLGPVDLLAPDGQRLEGILSQPKRLALLVYLVLACRTGFCRRDTLLALFWPELDGEHARGALRQALRFLRRALGEGALVTRGDEEVGVDQALLWCDAVAFERAVTAGRSAEAMALYRGEFMDGFHLGDAAPEYEEWLSRERTRLRGLAARAAWALADASRALGDGAAALEWGRRAVTLAPADEGVLRRLVMLLDGLGDRAGALRAYEEFARRLAEELSAQPSVETQALIQEVRARTGVPRLPAGEEGTRPTTAPTAVGSTPGPAKARRWTRSPLLVLVLAGVLAVGGYLAAFVRGHTPHRVAVAILPAEMLGGDSTTAYLAEGVTDQLITNLAQVRVLKVINRQTMMSFTGSRKTSEEVAGQLGVDAVVSSVIHRLDDSVTLTVQMVTAGSNEAMWAMTYLGARGELPRLERDIARAVAEQARVVLRPDERARLSQPNSFDSVALDRYLRGRHWWNRRGKEPLLRAIALFNEALDADPTFAPAYSGMADAYVQLGYGGFLRPADAFPKAKAAAGKALELDSALAEPHAALGYASMYFDWNWEAADREFRLAIDRNASYATAHEWYGLFLAAMGRFEDAQAEERRAQELDPLSVAVACTAGWVLHYSGRQDEAATQLRTALRMDSTYAIGRLYLGRVFQAIGKPDSAIAQYEATGRQRQWVQTIAGLGYVYGEQGRREEAVAVLAQLDSLSKGQYVTAYARALVYTALGDKDSAFAWLERGFQERTHWMVWLKRDRRWAPLRADARFVDLVKRVGLPP